MRRIQLCRQQITSLDAGMAIRLKPEVLGSARVSSTVGSETYESTGRRIGVCFIT